MCLCAYTCAQLYAQHTLKWVNFYQREKLKALKITKNQMYHLSPVILLDKELLGPSAQ